MSGARVYGAPGARTRERMASVGGPPWQVPVALIAAAVIAYVAGALALLGGAGDLAAGAWYGRHQLAAAHLVGLGFVSVTAVAALLQLVPVLLRTTLAHAWRGAATGAALWAGAAIMENIARTGLFRAEAVAELIDAHLQGRRDNGRALWGMLNYMMWHELYIQPAERADMAA